MGHISGELVYKILKLVTKAKMGHISGELGTQIIELVMRSKWDT